MSIEFEVSGSARLHVLAAQIRAAGQKGLGQEMAKALNTAATPLQASVREESARTLPRGYAPVFSESLRFRTALRTAARTASLRLTTYADGKRQRRDIRAINQGLVRHPLFGRRTRWYVTRVQPGFFDRGTRDAADQAEKKMLTVLDDFAERLL